LANNGTEIGHGKSQPLMRMNRDDGRCHPKKEGRLVGPISQFNISFPGLRQFGPAIFIFSSAVKSPHESIQSQPPLVQW
jgi:hypothetical protein